RARRGAHRDPRSEGERGMELHEVPAPGAGLGRGRRFGRPCERRGPRRPDEHGAHAAACAGGRGGGGWGRGPRVRRGPRGRRRRRLTTVVSLAGGIVVVIAWLMVGLTILRGFNVSLGPLVLSAGIAGVALGFGAQTLVRDTISGLFIVLERQYDIGDVVDLETDGGLVSGTVEALSLRITSVRQFDGTLSIVPNGAVHVVRNQTRGCGRAIVD